MNRISWRLAAAVPAIVTMAIALGSCGTDASQRTVNAATVTIGTPTEATQPPTIGASAIIKTAVERALTAGSYRFAAEVEALVGGKKIQARLSGWVDRGDRLLVTKIGDIEISTSVIAGAATVTGPNGTHEVPLGEADKGPSLEILTGLDQVTVESDEIITGYLSPDKIEELGMLEEAADGADVKIRITPEGDLSGYTMIDRRGRWTVDANFDTFGGDVRS